jgi:hypothetical protein
VSNFVYDNLPVPGAKTDNPEQVVREASIPTNQKTTAAEVNELTAAATGLRTAVNEVAPFYNVMRYANGATIGDGATDATTALQAAFDAAAAAAQIVAGLAVSTPEVVIPAGGFLQSKPLFVPAGGTVRGAGPGATVLSWAPFTWGHSLIAGDDDDGANSIHLTSSFGGGALVCDFDNGTPATKTFVDISQYTYGRLPAGSWTIRFARRLTNVLADAAQALPLIYIGAAAAWSNFPTIPTALNLFLDPFAVDGSMRLSVRYNNIETTVTVPFVTTPVLLDNTWYEVELDYDAVAGTMRVFLNGELWTRGAYALTGAGPGSDSSKLVQHVWERFSIGSTVGGFYPQEDFIFSTPVGAMKGFHLSSAVRHTASYVAVPLTDPTPDTNTLLFCNFQTTYKGTLVATGINGTWTVYLRPVRNVITEQPRVQIRDLSLLAGSGVRLEFASQGLVENVITSYASDGFSLLRNCYFTHLRHVRALNAGRGGFINIGGAYNIFTALDAAAPIQYAMLDSNVHMDGCAGTAQGGAVCGLLLTGGTGVVTAFAIDAELSSGSEWQAALVVQDPNSYTFEGCTIYNPVDHRASKSPILVLGSASLTFPTGVSFIGGWCLFVPAGVPLIRLVGTGTDLANKIAISALQDNASPLCSVAGQAHDPFNRARGNFQISAGATTHQVDLPYAGFGTAYEVSITPVDASAGASAGCTRVRKVAKSDDHFIVTVEAAPGGSETANFDYLVEVEG